MRSGSVVACLLVFLCVMNSVYGDLGDFFAHLPEEVGEAFRSTWTAIIQAIKKPVRIKRLGSGGKKKSVTIRHPKPTTVMITTELTTNSLNMTSYVSSNKHKIPVLPTPLWKSFEDWRNLLKPHFAEVSYGDGNDLTSTHKDEGYEGISGGKQAAVTEEEYFGVLMFI